MLKNRTILIVFFIILSTTLGACGNSNVSQVGEKKNVVIGFAMDTLVHARWLKDKEIFQEEAKKLGAEVILQIANSDSKLQKKQVQYLLDQNIDVLVLVPHDAELATELVKMAKDKGVKVISYDRLVKNANADLYISFDNTEVGRLMGEEMFENVPKGNYLILNGSKSDNNSSMYHDGYMSVISDAVKNGDVRINNETWVVDWLYENAYKFVSDTISKNKNIDAVIAANDTLASATIDVLSEKRLLGKVKIVGHDADLNGCQRIVEGKQLATIYKPIEKLAKIAAQSAIKMARGEEVKANSTIDDGKHTVPYYKITPILVTKKNMYQTIIKDGFHSIEDVYVNVPKSKWPNK